MDSWVFFPFSLPFFSSLLILCVLSPCLSQSVDDNYTACSNKFKCGKLTAGYPFFGDDRPPVCGHPGLSLSCQNNDKARININKLTYQVLDIDEENQILRVAREDYLNSRICGSELANTTLDSSLFEFDSGVGNISFFYGCLSSIAQAFPLPTVCNKSGLVYALPGDSWNPDCSDHVIVPTSEPIAMPILDFLTLDRALNDGFQVKWKVDSEACRECSDSKGACGVDSSNHTVCFCPNQTSSLARCPLQPPSATATATIGGSSGRMSVGLGIGIGGAGFIFILLGCWLFLVIRRRKRKVALSENKDISRPPSSKSLTTPTTNFSQSIPSYPSSKSDLEKASTYFGVQVFSYTELEKATDNFDASKELGDGGFGVVYYGVLSDGRGVAVKRLYESSVKRVEQFMNEIEILARLRHKNLVTLYGCTSKHSRDLLLVYEYIPNGTVADHLLGKQTNSGLLTWPVRLSIALETAEALAYLHAFDVIHRDVKTNNILLDNNFHVKVADFGLSRLFPTNVTHVSTAPQGTPGYVDPEYYQCYHLTDKSDVYSFGVVLIELISSLPAVDTNRHRHDINLANMAINKIQNHALHELVDPCLGFERDYAVGRMITSVVELAFRCLQQERDMRPSMEEVREILRRIQNENFGGQKEEVVDIGADDVGLLKNRTPPLSPNSVVTDKWVSSSTTTSSF